MYRNGDFVADRVLQPIPVQKQSNKYWTYGPDNLRSLPDSRRPGTYANEMELTLSAAGPYFCDGHALMDWIPDETMEGVDAPIDPDVDTTIALTDAIFLNKEINTVSALAAACSPIDLSASSYANAWDNSAVDPIASVSRCR